MDRIIGVGTTDIGAGRRGFRDEDLPTGIQGTVVTAAFLNSLQEEIMQVLLEAGIEPDPNDWTQLAAALKIIRGNADRLRWLAVLSMTTAAPPAGAAAGDSYLVPAAATGVWAANIGKIAEWTGSAWSYATPVDGHGISLPDGRIFERVNGTYVEKIALDVQSGKWSTGVIGGTSNAITATLTPTAPALVTGMSVVLNITTPNTGPVTLNLANSGALPVVNVFGAPLSGRELVGPVRFTYDGAKWWASVTQPVLTTNLTFYVNAATGNDNNNGTTPGTAFATIQKAVLFAQRINLNGYGISIIVADSNYVGPVILGAVSGGTVSIIGNIGNPANCVVSQPVGSSFLAITGRWKLSGFTVSSSGASGGDAGCGVYAAASGAAVDISAMSFGSCFGPHLYASNGGNIIITGQINIIGNAPIILSAAVSGNITLNPADNPVLNTPNNITISNASVVADDLGTIWGRFSLTIGAGVVTGKRFSASKNGVIDSLGAGVNHYPGSIAGSTVTGGQYA